MVIALLSIFILSMTVSLYTIYQLHKLEDITKSILVVDNNVIDLEQKLSDLMLSMVGYDKKYIITKDEELIKKFDEAKEDFEKNLVEITSVADTEESKNYFRKVNDYYQTYQSSFKQEVGYIQSKEPYNKEDFKGDRDSAVDGVMNNLRNLRIYSQITTYDKVRELDETEAGALKVAVVITITSLMLILAISVLITINITRPLSAIKKKTRRIARGDFRGQLKLSSPPEIKELEQSFNAMCVRLQALDTMKTDFFALMSHELRTPLASIKEATNLLMESLHEETITERQHKLFSIMKEENNRLIKLVNSLLDLSKMEAGMMVYAFNRSDLISLIKRAVREIEPLAEAKNIAITIDTDQALPLIRVDNERILQVLRNLIGNAVKFTPEDGKVHVFAKVTEQGVKVSVADTGVGIAKESLTTIFDKFQQEEVLTHFHKIKGTGLGLSLVKHIIKAHGGRIWVESALGQGSTFSFVLPA